MNYSAMGGFGANHGQSFNNANRGASTAPQHVEIHQQEHIPAAVRGGLTMLRAVGLFTPAAAEHMATANTTKHRIKT